MPLLASPVAGLPSLEPRLPTKAAMKPYALQATRLQRTDRILAPRLVTELPGAGEMHSSADLNQAIQHLQAAPMGAGSRRPGVVWKIYQDQAGHRATHFEPKNNTAMMGRMTLSRNYRERRRCKRKIADPAPLSSCDYRGTAAGAPR